MAVESQAAGSRSVPRVPGAVPLLGHALKLWRDPFGFMTSLWKYGDLVRVDLGTMPVYVATSAKLVHEVTVRQARSFEKGRFFDRLRSLAGNGLATANGDIHREHRRLIQPMFSKDHIAGYSGIMSDNARTLANAWTPGQEVELEQAMAEYAINTLASTMFSTDIGRPAVEAIRTNLPLALKNLLVRAASPKVLDRVPIRANREFDTAAAHLTAVIDEVIKAARGAGHTDRNDLLSLLLAEKDLSDVEVRDELSTILFAGAETTAATLAWTFHELAHHPGAEEQVVTEIEDVVGDRPVTIEDVPRLPALRRVLDEVIRLHGVTMLMRRTTEPVELGGVVLPTATEVAFSPYALHRDPRTYVEADRFDPDRWLPQRQQEAGIAREDFIPFGAGNRKCIGDQFMYTEATIALATLLAQWQLVPAAGHTPKEVVSAVAHADRIPMVVQPRRT
ncbi:cytochrome P450 [Streptomyces gilvosporeus]|uniref:Cytochrome P450 n=1 Tax=Streptomyces gilvosporeus TaxID=553510 RepID=A0A1V0TIP7_9ACTN|nr:cytochrome P450 [Streptomyces gilvosporeus]ARF52804.1 cytochrome P450 [Streptomyces gilvosporeus]